MLELRKSPSAEVRELEGDLKHLREKAVRLIDKLVMTQSRIQTKKWQLLKLRERYVLPDGRTR
jgi:hypothetical protein